MPVHGEWRHLRAHARLGIESGVAEDRVVIAEDGDVVDLVEGQPACRHVRSRYVYVDGLAVGDVSESLLTERRILGDGGFIALPSWWTRSPARWSAVRPSRRRASVRTRPSSRR